MSTPGTGNSDFEGLAAFDGVLMFKANAGSGIKLSYTDGIQVTPSANASAIVLDDQSEGLVVSGTFYFTAVDGLYRMDSKDGSPVRLIAYTAVNRVYALKNMEGDLYFVLNNQPSLYKYVYRKAGYDAARDSTTMDPSFETGLKTRQDGNPKGQAVGLSQSGE